MTMTLKDLAVSHDYYCSANAGVTYQSWKSFIATAIDDDPDLNLCFRFDIGLKNDEDETEGYCMQISRMQQRKGKYVPIIIEHVAEEDVPSIVEYLTVHFEKMKQLWQPFTL